MGRHTEEEIAELATRDLVALANFLADKPYLMGQAPCAADAAVFAFVTAALCPVFKTPIRIAAELQPNLVAYRDRLMAQYFPAVPAQNAAA